MREADLLWEYREEAGKVEAAIDIYKKVLSVNEENYEACWKIARAYSSLGDRRPGTKETKNIRKETGRESMLFAKKALELQPHALEGNYYYAFSLSQYSIGVGSFMTITKGLDRKFEKHMNIAYNLNKYYDNAGPLRGLGRYYYYLPWPKKDLKKSIQYLKEAVAYTPNNIRSHVYLAESYLELGKNQLARTYLQKAVNTSPDLKQEVDAKRWKERAEELLITLNSSLE
jgi:tetratricopeptide (TPR) repeat protein